MQGVDYVFHAAALKQVPSCEFFPLEAIWTNAIGADNVMKAALACNVKNMIVLSTDKAVYPINAMGMSKALMEKLMVAIDIPIVFNDPPGDYEISATELFTNQTVTEKMTVNETMGYLTSLALKYIHDVDTGVKWR